jgi:YeeE/YedE family (DUF395).
MNMNAQEIADTAMTKSGEKRRSLWVWFLLGILFGITLTKAEVISWFRIQEMFRFQAFHMYGIIGSAIAVAAGSNLLLKRRQTQALCEEPPAIPVQSIGWGYRYWIGGTIFGLGWALTGACPGPLFALIGGGVTVMSLAVLSAVAGTWVYGYLRPKLPH